MYTHTYICKASSRAPFKKCLLSVLSDRTPFDNKSKKCSGPSQMGFHFGAAAEVYVAKPFAEKNN